MKHPEHPESSMESLFNMLEAEDRNTMSLRQRERELG